MEKYTTFTSAADMDEAEKFRRAHLFAPETLPVTFIYGGENHRGFSPRAKVDRGFADSNIETVTMTDVLPGGVELKAKIEIYRDYPVAEWTLYLTNRSNEVSPLLEDLRPIDCEFAYGGAKAEHVNGDTGSADGYTVTVTDLTPGTTLRFAPRGGRPTDGAFPYQRVLTRDGGILISIGWPGQWFCLYEGGSGSFGFSAGQETVHTVIKPGETFRSPRITVMFYLGDRERGVNIWRRWFNAHVTPKSRGSLYPGMIYTTETGGGIEYTLSDEKNQLDAIRFVKENRIPANMWWIDAGWYPCKNPEGKPDWLLTGSWYPDPERYPNGLKPISNACHEAGMELLVWFEPERVRPGFSLATEHPEWMLEKKHYPENSAHNFLLNLADPDCCDWLCKYIAKTLNENGIDIYRQDYNIAPLAYWRDNEEENRGGMCENLYVQGYLRYWDYLLLNVPNLKIDSCASGGRRNDMETMRRSVPLHPSDYGYGYHHINQAFRHTLYAWFPYTRSWAVSWDKNNEYYRHADYYAPEAVIDIDNFKTVNSAAVITNTSPVSELRRMNDRLPYLKRMLGLIRRFSEIALHGDFYALTPNHRDNTRWTVFQFDVPESGRGVFQVLRNNQAKDETVTVFPKGLERGKLYKMENPETGESVTAEAEKLSKEGYTFALPERSGALWFYERIGGGRADA